MEFDFLQERQTKIMKLLRLFTGRGEGGRGMGGGEGRDMEEKKWGRGGGVRWRSKVLPQKLKNARGRKRKLPDSDSKRSLYARKTTTKETNYKVEVYLPE